MLAQAGGAAQAARATAAARVHERAAADLAATEAKSRTDAEEITRRAARQLPSLVDDVVERVRRDIAALATGEGTPAGSTP